MARASKVGDILYTPDKKPRKIVSIEEIVAYFEQMRQLKEAASMQQHRSC